jgi:hypothetical protein
VRVRKLAFYQAAQISSKKWCHCRPWASMRWQTAHCSPSWAWVRSGGMWDRPAALIFGAFEQFK